MTWTLADLQKKGFVVSNEGATIVARKPEAERKHNLATGLVELLVTPIPKPRMSKRDKWKKRPIVLRYFEYCDNLRAAAQQVGFTLPDNNFWIKFYLPIPKTHLKRELEGKPHQNKPDVDNLLKAVMDAMNKSDQSVYDCRISKYYSSRPRITIEIIDRIS